MSDSLNARTRFGFCVTTGKSYVGNNRSTNVEVICDCGNTKFIRLSSLKSGKSKSCGCFRKKELMKRKIVENSDDAYLLKKYRDILRRCYNQSSLDYRNYGARGIKVCEEWKSSFESFLSWAKSAGWYDGCKLSIDRIDNSKDYEPSNCRWATDEVQRRNKRNNIRLTIGEETKILADWGRDERCSVTLTTFMARIKYGWSAVDAMSVPKLKIKKQLSL